VTPHKYPSQTRQHSCSRYPKKRAMWGVNYGTRVEGGGREGEGERYGRSIMYGRRFFGRH
jgi:hypothetical protein